MSNISWPWPSSSKKDPTDPHAVDDNAAIALWRKFHELPPSMLALAAFSLGSVTAVSSVMVYRRYGRRIRNVNHLTPDVLTGKRWLKGVVTSVGDADNFKFFHTPALGGYTWPFKFRSVPSIGKDLKDETLHIRMAGVDAPEASHFGKPAQPYSAESLAWLRDRILGKTVYVLPLRKDQYLRVVARVHQAPRILPGFLFLGKDLSAEMLKAGWATVYEQAGAEYGKLGKEGYLLLEAQAKAARRGMWARGTAGESPAEYKRRHAAASSLEEAEAARPTASRLSRKKKRGWFSRLFSR
ncbi:hypothetical protein CVT26_009023 [Gymnopilus dilepis]|uniref:TNase-like domain-containing protein n=1 Tax=Gymnopilus dilepis TaxID=231916 RepID=A0A409YB96_9AGAR|nr:hypothetical protein CVT26_009023 [Gymnopilus dilepis]